MSMPAIDCVCPAVKPAFFNVRSEPVHPAGFAIVYWDGPGDTLYAFEDHQAFERQRVTAERHFVHVQLLTEDEAAQWIADGGKAMLHEVSAGGVAVFGYLGLAAG